MIFNLLIFTCAKNWTIFLLHFLGGSILQCFHPKDRYTHYHRIILKQLPTSKDERQNYFITILATLLRLKTCFHDAHILPSAQVLLSSPSKKKKMSPPNLVHIQPSHWLHASSTPKIGCQHFWPKVTPLLQSLFNQDN
jgi:hypothetical protein